MFALNHSYETVAGAAEIMAGDVPDSRVSVLYSEHFDFYLEYCKSQSESYVH